MDRPERRELTPDEITRVASAVVAACAQEPGVRLAYLFGSVARGGPAADLDLGVWFEPGIPPLDMLATCERVAAFTERVAHPPVPVDVRPLNGSGPRLRFDVVTTGRLLHARAAGEQVAVEAQWLSEWHDFLPFWRRQVDAVLRGGRP